MKSIVKVKNKTNRIDWIDTFKGLAFFLVIWGHTFPTSKGAIRKYIYSFHMPLFFFASGLMFKDQLDLSFKDYIKKKIKSLLVPYLVINLIFILINYVLYLIGVSGDFGLIEQILGTLYSNNKILKIPCGPTWFIPTLFLSEIVFYGMKKYIKDDIKIANSVGLLGIIGYINSLSEYQVAGPWHLEAFFTGFVFYYLGYLFMKYLPKFKAFFKDKIRLFFYGLTLGSVGIIIAAANRRVSMYGNLYGSITLFYIGALCSIIAVIMFVNLFLKKSFIFKQIGKTSLFFLGYHEILIILIGYFFPASRNGNANILLTAIIVTMILFPLSFLVYKYCPIFIGKFNNNLIRKNKCDKICLFRRKK